MTKQRELFSTAFLYVAVFMIGFISCILVFYTLNTSGVENPMRLGSDDTVDIEAPNDWISLNQISMTSDKIIIRVDNASLSAYAPSGSMKPVLDQGANGIRIVPTSEDQIEVGDIITFGNDKIVHRVIEKGEDLEGVYFITQGDNNAYPDGKVRFEDIHYVTIGILY